MVHQWVADLSFTGQTVPTVAYGSYLQVLGLASAAAGAAGCLGKLSRTPSLIILGGLAAMITIMLSFTYLEQVHRFERS